MPNVILYAFPPLYILVLEQILTAYLIVKLICCLHFSFLLLLVSSLLSLLMSFSLMAILLMLLCCCCLNLLMVMFALQFSTSSCIVYYSCSSCIGIGSDTYHVVFICYCANVVILIRVRELRESIRYFL